MKNKDSVKFYTRFPTSACPNMLVNLITPEADKFKYWDKNKHTQKKRNAKLHLLLSLAKKQVSVPLGNF